MSQDAFSGKDATVYKDGSQISQEVVGWTFTPTLDVGEHVSDETDGNVTTVEGAKNFTATVIVKLPKNSRIPLKIGDTATIKCFADGGEADDFIQFAGRVTEGPYNVANATPDGIEVPFTFRPTGSNVIYSGIFCPDTASSSCVW